ncbi:hypothetical protein [Solimicrobium silvestre]|uniref:Uncharacterized protein n=1 Tax=Solimicrobium silvestre TaxID=2099400 RepID=A0A2S9H5T9_9BURK|nr:hypothetical protein [Solimicrobium silvestre]PRC95246.1 hypothetical protein S2091_0441 [Solimicrobium silvestre]
MIEYFITLLLSFSMTASDAVSTVKDGLNHSAVIASDLKKVVKLNPFADFNKDVDTQSTVNINSNTPKKDNTMSGLARAQIKKQQK